MKKPKPSITALATALKKESVDAVLRQNKEGLLYGITYIDFKTGCVFNGSDLGKEYSAKGMLQRCAVEPEKSLALKREISQNNFSSAAEKTSSSNSINLRLMDDLIKPELNQNAAEPFEMKRFKKKKKALRQRI